MRVGVLGGSFDPIHLGHLRAAEVAWRELELDEVAFVPARLPPHRPELETPARDRFAMVALATALHPAFTVCDVELDRQGPSFTVDTLEALAARRSGAQLVLILGSDAYADFDGWRDAARIRRLAELAVVARPGSDPPPVLDGVRRLGEPGLAISATRVRELARRGESVRFLVPPSVADYIAKRGLYR